MHEFNQSLRYDKRMHAADITGSIAYAKALTKVGILTSDEEQRIVRGLQVVGEEWNNGTVSFSINEQLNLAHLLLLAVPN